MVSRIQKFLLLLTIISLAATTTVLWGKDKYIPLDLAVVHNNQGVSFLAKNDLDRAEVEFKTAIELDPKYPEAHNNLGLILKYKGHFEEAEKLFKKTISLKSKWATPYNHLGTVYLAEKDLSKAESSIKKATSLDKKYADAFYNLGVVYIEMAKENEKDSKDPKPKWKSAVKSLQKATTIDTRLFHAHMDLADTYRKLGEIDKAILRYRLAIETNPKDPTAWGHLGDLYTQTGDSEKAKECFEKAALLGPMPQESLVSQAEILIKDKKWGDALTLLSRALEKDPRNPMIYFDMGFVYASQGQLPLAVQNYQKAIGLNPNFFPAFFNLGMAYRDLHDVRDAIPSFQQALRIRPDHPESLYELASLYDLILNPAAAKQTYCRFLQVADKNKFKEEAEKARAATQRWGGC